MVDGEGRGVAEGGRKCSEAEGVRTVGLVGSERCEEGVCGKNEV